MESSLRSGVKIWLPGRTVQECDAIGEEDHDARRHGVKALACPECRGPVHVRRYQRPTVWHIFAHDPGRAADCTLARFEEAGESYLHHVLKSRFVIEADAVPGWTAEPEVALQVVDPDTGRPPIVDVVATGPGGPRGYEIQLSPSSAAKVAYRQRIRLADGGLRECLWATKVRPAWAGQVAWAQLGGFEDNVVRVVDGVVGWDDDAGDFVTVDPMTLRRFVTRQLGDRLMFVPDLVGPGAGGIIDRTAGAAAAKRVRARARTGGKGTDRCDRLPVEEQVSSSLESSDLLIPEEIPTAVGKADSCPDTNGWRPVPNLPGIPQITEGRNTIHTAFNGHTGPRPTTPAEWHEYYAAWTQSAVDRVRAETTRSEEKS